MEFASGGELFTLVANGGAMDEARARVYFKQITSAAAYCHSQGVCHRDLKLENVLLAAPGASAVKITGAPTSPNQTTLPGRRCSPAGLKLRPCFSGADFGLSKDSEQHSQPKTKRVGTISYMAPEVAMASGEMPYSGTPGSSREFSGL